MSSRLALPALVLALALTGCDATGTDSALLQEDASDAAVSIADALALNSGGALDDAASVAALVTADASKSGPMSDRPGCSGDRTFDEATSTWTTTVACERGREDGRRYHAFSRTTTHRFLDEAGAPLPGREGATAVEFAIVEGSGEHRTPRGSAIVSDLGADLDVLRLDDGQVSASGTYSREGSRTALGRRGGSRAVDYALSLELDGVTGPAGRRDRWRGATAGSVSGLYTATVTVTNADGEVSTRDVEREFTVSFPVDGRARIALGGRSFTADAATGEVL